MQQHFNEVPKLVKLGEKSDSCAKRFATQFHDANRSPFNQHEGTICSIIWQGNPISVVKTFATKNCALCAKERMQLQFLNNPESTHSFLSTLITKSTVSVDTDHVSTGVSRPPPALTSQSMMKESAQHMKLAQILPCAMFAQLMSNWKHCEDQNRENVFHLFPKCWMSQNVMEPVSIQIRSCVQQHHDQCKHRH